MKKTDPLSHAAAFDDDGRPADQLSDSELADAYFDNKSRVDAFAPTEERCKSLAREVRKRFEEKPADGEFELKGQFGLVLIGKKQNERTMPSVYALYKLSKLKIEEFLEKCRISMGEAESISGSEDLIQEARTGFRPLKAILRVRQHN